MLGGFGFQFCGSVFRAQDIWGFRLLPAKYWRQVYCSSFPRRRESRKKAHCLNKRFYVYILASKRNGTLYTGVTSDLPKRVWEHKEDLIEGFTKKYNVKKLVHYEIYDDAESAITREKRIKKWRRKWKLKLIEEKNPQWKDLYEEILR